MILLYLQQHLADVIFTIKRTKVVGIVGFECLLKRKHLLCYTNPLRSYPTFIILAVITHYE